MMIFMFGTFGRFYLQIDVDGGGCIIVFLLVGLVERVVHFGIDGSCLRRGVRSTKVMKPELVASAAVPNT